MDLFSLKCANCGYTLSKDANEDKYICKACGSEFLINTNIASKDDFTVIAGVLEKYTGSSPLIVIPENISVIGSDCFAGMELIKSVSIPNGIISIGNNAFCGCTGLKYVSFPESLQNIGDCAFKDTGLINVSLLDSIVHIGKDAFMNCQSLEKVSLPKNQILNYNRTFKQCSKLTEVNCNLKAFCLSFKPSIEARKNGDSRPTLFDAFQATPYLTELSERQTEMKCIICGSKIGEKGVCEQCGAVHIDLDVPQVGCYVATAVYGSYNCPEVWTLRRYRDNRLAKVWYGQIFIKVYYAISPILVKWFGHTAWFKNMWKGKLDRMVARLRMKGFDSTPYSDKNW